MYQGTGPGVNPYPETISQTETLGLISEYTLTCEILFAVRAREKIARRDFAMLTGLLSLGRHGDANKTTVWRISVERNFNSLADEYILYIQFIIFCLAIIQQASRCAFISRVETKTEKKTEKCTNIISLPFRNFTTKNIINNIGIQIGLMLTGKIKRNYRHLS